jgi:hypothetical protein
MKHLNEEKVSERLFLLSEYKYYNDLNEAPEDEEIPADDQDMEAGDDITDDDLEGDLGGDNIEGETGDDLEGDIAGALDDMGQDMPAEDMGGDEVEIDVSEIVDGVNQNAESINDISQKMDSMADSVSSYINQLMQTNKQITQQIQQMGQNIEQEFKKRAPTPYENIQMRSLSSYPYNQKLTDFFKPAKGDEYSYSIDNPNSSNTDDYQIKVKQGSEDETPKEYVLTQQDVEDDFNEIDVRNSL